MLLLHAVLTAHSLAGHGRALADPMPDPSPSATSAGSRTRIR
jgi:hypothetical protein